AAPGDRSSRTPQRAPVRAQADRWCRCGFRARRSSRMDEGNLPKYVADRKSQSRPRTRGRHLERRTGRAVTGVLLFLAATLIIEPSPAESRAAATEQT